MGDNKRFVVGINQTEAPAEFEINPRLQRTRAEGTRQGFKLASYIPNFPVQTKDLIRLKNRAVPQNPNFVESPRVLQRDIIGGLDVPNPPALSKLGEGGSPVNDPASELRKRG